MTAKLESLAVDITAENVRERLRLLTFPPTPGQLPAAPVKVGITVTATMPGMQPATGTNTATIKN